MITVPDLRADRVCAGVCAAAAHDMRRKGETKRDGRRRRKATDRGFKGIRGLSLTGHETPNELRRKVEPKVKKSCGALMSFFFPAIVSCVVDLMIQILIRKYYSRSSGHVR